MFLEKLNKTFKNREICPVNGLAQYSYMSTLSKLS